MSFRGFFKFALLAAQVVVGIATPLDSKASEELVQTPAGLFPKSKVHAIPDGASVHQTSTEVQIIGANSTVLFSVPYTPPTTSKFVGPLLNPASASSNRRDLQSGYIAYAYWENTASSPISFLGSNWNVPNTPASWDDQLLYWWNGLVPIDFSGGILQPVLQYGFSPAGGGEYYAIASWWLTGTDIFHTGITQVSPGTFLQGQISLTGTSISGGVTTYSYSCTFVGFPSTTISASTTVVLSWVYEALETYGTVQISDLPTGNTIFSTIDITLQNGQRPSSLDWTPVSDTTDDITMTVLSTSSVIGALLITY
ncbi:hypothetical protein CPB84DRAFT_1847026 [Gymnopilus junonius]|uniref:Uncharacterized protein n=1 Tax=Gymnopilus junonius TaxID=109634 RepID=A0A9P5TNJ6_GYMJU|nr:hypothetical protein CPB84DRAFT_1847026 [Gymnopilus junonius]